MSSNPLWHGKPYYSLDAYCKNTFGQKLYKSALDAGFTCPNRDGTLDTRGCIFCSTGGSGEFAASLSPSFSLKARIDEALTITALLKRTDKVIAYFQAYTNTYAPVEKLEFLYRAALEHPKTAGISIATRPDCLPKEVLALLNRLQTEYSAPRNGRNAKFIWIELGLQTVNEQTAAYIRRGYALSVFDQAVSELSQIGLPVIAHIILGLPGETKQDCQNAILYLNERSVFGIKLQLLHVLEGTDLYQDFQAGKFQALSQSEYTDLLIDCIGHLRPDIVIHRLTGDGDKRVLAAPDWSKNKRAVLNTLHHEMKLRKIHQGIWRENTCRIR